MINIDYQDKRPIYEQVSDKFKQLIVKGILPADEKMPSVRSLAIDLSINPNTIQKAYQELERLGFIYTIQGRGNFVSYSAKWIDNTSLLAKEKFADSVRELITLGMSNEEIHNLIDEMTIRKGERL